MNQPIQITIDQPAAIGAGSGDAPLARQRVSAFDLVAATPWAIQPDMLDTIAAIARGEGEGVEAVEAKMGRPLQNTRKVTMRDGVAVVPITGPVFRYANLFTEISGATSLDVLAKDFTAALEDPQVSAIVLDINSPGGQATGIADFSAMVRAAGKPVVAFVDGMAASAAYWIAAAAQGGVVMSKSAMAGNVGAVLGLDTRKDANRIEIVSSQSPNKRPDATTEAGRAQIQALIDALAQVFIEDVAAYRGKTPEQVVADWNGGDMFIGARAVAAGMADRIGTLEEVIAGLAGKSQTKPASLNSQGVKAMQTVDELRAAHPDLCAALVEEGRTAGATAERQRIHDIEALALPGHDALIAQFKADGKTSGAEAAVAILAAERQIVAQRGAQLGVDAPKPVAHAAAPEDKPHVTDDSLPLEQRAQVKWDNDPAIRAEFGTFDTYLAYAKAHDAGTVKILSK